MPSLTPGRDALPRPSSLRPPGREAPASEEPTGVPEEPTGRLVLLATSPRVAPGLLSWPAWQMLRSSRVLTANADHPQVAPLAAAGVGVEVLPGLSGADAVSARAERLLTAAENGAVVWLLAQDGDGALVEALTAAYSAASTPAGRGGAPRLEVMTGSHDLPGARALDLVAVMDRLRSPGGCPWDAEQTHVSLVKYLLEEAYETVEAIEADGADAPAGGGPAVSGDQVADRAALREELGDVLLQVAFHARIAQEHATEPFSFDDVAAGIVAKLIGRHPHVFADAEAPTPEHVEANWDRIKAAEKRRTSAVDGVPLAQPALSLAAKLVGRADRAGLTVPLADTPTADGAASNGVADPGLPAVGDAAVGDAAVGDAAAGLVVSGLVVAGDAAAVGDHLLALAAAARRAGVDPEEALRGASRRYRARIKAVESGDAESGSAAEPPR